MAEKKNSLDKYKLKFEMPKQKKLKISPEAVKKMNKDEKKAAKAKLKAEKVPQAMNIDIRVYTNFARLGLPLAVEFAKARGSSAVVINIAFFEIAMVFKKVKR